MDDPFGRAEVCVNPALANGFPEILSLLLLRLEEAGSLEASGLVNNVEYRPVVDVADINEDLVVELAVILDREFESPGG